MKRVPTQVVRQRSEELTALFESFSPYTGLVGNVEQVWVSDTATDGTHLVSRQLSTVSLCSQLYSTVMVQCSLFSPYIGLVGRVEQV